MPSDDQDYEWETPLTVQHAVNAYHMHGDALRLNALDKAIRDALTAARAEGFAAGIRAAAAVCEARREERQGEYIRASLDSEDEFLADGARLEAMSCRDAILALTTPDAPEAGNG